jgi:hypothetical protein
MSFGLMVYYGWRKSKKIKSLGVSNPKDINMMVYYGWRKSKKIKSLGVSGLLTPKDFIFYRFPSAIVNHHVYVLWITYS